MIAAFLVLLAVNSALGVYPVLKDVVYDPKDFDVLYLSSKGAFQETWTASRTIRVTAFILASQVNLCGADGKYRENVTLTVSSVVYGKTALIAQAHFAGDVGYGEEIRVSLYNSTTSSYPQFVSSNVPTSYVVRVEFGLAAGIYPWHTSRSFASACATNTNGQGHIIGIEYTW